MRRSHYLRSNSQGETPSLVGFVDTETKPYLDPDGTQHHRLYFGYVEVWRMQVKGSSKWQLVGDKVFYTPGEFWDFLISKIRVKSCLTLYAHNWQFDGAILEVDRIPLEMGFECTSLILDHGIAIVKFRSKNRSIHLLDTANYFHIPLETLGKSIGVEKLPIPDYEASTDEWLAYCKNDTKILRESIFTLIRFISENDLGNYQPTAASQAFGAYRHRFMGNKILIHDRSKVLDLERESYHGGRVEAFFIGVCPEEMFQADINSMYPYVMKIYPYPTVLKHTLYKPSLRSVRDLLKTRCLIARCKLKTDLPVYPVMKEGKIVYPIGEFETVLSTPEIAFSLAHGHLKSVSYAAVYERSHIFSDYVTFFYGKRQEYKAGGNIAFEFLCKLMLNSLYGKFGQRSAGWVDVEYEGFIPPDFTEWLDYDIETKQVIKYRSIMGRIQTKHVGGESYNSLPAIASHVTAYARVLLWKLIQSCGSENVYYVDTDSLMINEQGLKRLYGRLKRQGLGGMKLERSSDQTVIYGAKDYKMGKTVKLKGIRKDAVQLSSNEYRQYQFSKWIPLLRKGIRGEILVKPIIKKLKRTYDKGVVTPSGRVKPYSVEASSSASSAAF